MLLEKGLPRINIQPGQKTTDHNAAFTGQVLCICTLSTQGNPSRRWCKLSSQPHGQFAQFGQFDREQAIFLRLSQSEIKLLRSFRRFIQRCGQIGGNPQ